jgi:hypothetical protein
MRNRFPSSRSGAIRGKLVVSFATVALALTGESAEATRLAEDLAKRFPQDTIVQLQCLPIIHSALALKSGDPGRAITALGWLRSMS